MTQDNEPFLCFVAERCELRPEARVPRTVLRHAYAQWCEEQGVAPETPRRLAARLRELGCVDTRTGTLAGWSGILLLNHKAPRDPRSLVLEEYVRTRVLKGGGVVLKAAVYADYLQWCKGVSMPPESKKRLSHALTRLYPEVRASSAWDKSRSASQPTWVGVSLRSQTRSLRLA